MALHEYRIELKIAIDEQSKDLLAMLVPCKFCKGRCMAFQVSAANPKYDDKIVSVDIYSTCEASGDEAEIDTIVQAEGFKAVIEEWNRFHSDPAATYWKDVPA